MTAMGRKRTLEFAKCLCSLVLGPQRDRPNGRLNFRVGNNGKEAPHLGVTIRPS